MDYEQYLYGPVTRDAAHRESPRRRLGRIGSLAFASGVGAGAVTALAVALGLNGAGGDRRTASPRPEVSRETPHQPPLPMTLAVSEDAVPTPGR
ncbi:MAG: hypothetical protein H6897_17105 [Rhodobacteraceae bacterium]|jgi:hypothetical protein|uniref:hypothetical protein n=1 Tax=Albidovulum sp. TaxID=1872424 RepID=UPI001D6C259B|nr:hypothetical protein [uncultured Defluviimonas sp.]MCB2127097.1 hypothetical protein [Paracoccaceae bacterium]MCC0071636.1 hypothetical protein [Paracoccaceae bacterium]